MLSWYLPVSMFYLLIVVAEYTVLIAFYLLFYYANLSAVHFFL
jgi:hypothetical protein